MNRKFLGIVITVLIAVRLVSLDRHSPESLTTTFGAWKRTYPILDHDKLYTLQGTDIDEFDPDRFHRRLRWPARIFTRSLSVACDGICDCLGLRALSLSSTPIEIILARYYFSRRFDLTALSAQSRTSPVTKEVRVRIGYS